MKFHYTNLDTCHTAAGVVIVVDVLRAFSTAAYAFSRGAEKIILVGDVEEAILLKSQILNQRPCPLSSLVSDQILVIV